MHVGNMCTYAMQKPDDVRSYVVYIGLPIHMRTVQAKQDKSALISISLVPSFYVAATAVIFISYLNAATKKKWI